MLRNSASIHSHRRTRGIGTREIVIALVLTAGAATVFVQMRSTPPEAELDAPSGAPAPAPASPEPVAESAPVVDALTDNGLAELRAVLPAADEPIREVIVAGQDGEAKAAQVAGAGKVPSGFPDDVPVYPNAESAGGLAVGGEGAAVAFVTPDDAGVVFAFYTRALEAQGWELDTRSMEPGLQDRLSAVKDSRTLWITISQAVDGSQILVAMQQSLASS